MENLDNLLDDAMLSKNSNLVPASKEKRFANLMIDYFFAIIFSMALFIILDLFSIHSMQEESPFMDRIWGMFCYALFYSIVEGGLRGKTIGKYITQTKVVNIDGSEPDLNTLIKRSFCRIVPFEQFSFLGDDPSGWHDKWTDTMVIDEQLSNAPAQSTINLDHFR